MRKYAFILIPLAIVGAGCIFSAPSYIGHMTDHFDGKKFHNQIRHEMGLMDALKWAFTRNPGPWETIQQNKIFDPPPKRVDDDSALFTFVNHATFLIQVNGLNILTDPMWSERASPVSFAGPMRVRPPGVAFNHLPKIDIILISHNHYDHLDIDTLSRISKRDKPLIIVGLGNGALLNKYDISNHIDLDWWQEHKVSEALSVFAVPAQHFSGRGLSDRDETLWGGYVIKSKNGNFFFAGDTGLGPHFQMIRDRFGIMNVALLPIGAYLPRWFMSHVHISPDEAVKAAQILGAHTSLGMHFGTFRLADDGQYEPVEKLHEAVSVLNTPIDFRVLDFGESFRLTPKSD